MLTGNTKDLCVGGGNRAPPGAKVLDARRSADRRRVPEARFQLPVLAIAAAARPKIPGNVRRDLLRRDNGRLSAERRFIFTFLGWVLMRGATRSAGENNRAPPPPPPLSRVLI